MRPFLIVCGQPHAIFDECSLNVPEGSGAISDTPRCLAKRALMKSIDEMAQLIAGDAEYYHAKHHSIGPNS
jgi:hypothetical protein